MKTRIATAVVCFLAVAGPAFPGCQPGNLINNCGFPTDITGWTVTEGSASHDPTGGNSTPGSLQVSSTTDIVFHQCVDVSGLVKPIIQGYGIDFRDNAANEMETVNLSVTDFTDVNCTPGNEAGNSDSVNVGLTSGSYQALADSYTVSATANGVRFQVVAEDFAGTIIGDFDDAFFGVDLVPVELQGFEVD